MTLSTALSFNTLLFLLGLVIGSFLNVIGSRYRAGGGLFNRGVIGGRSRCPNCREQLSWYELLPLVSFFWQRGRCRHCQKLISFQYPIIEILSGLALLLPYYFYNYYRLYQFSATLVGVWLLAALAMILLALIDWRLRIIPDQLVIFLAALGLIAAFLQSGSFLRNYAELVPAFDNQLVNHLLAGAVGFLFFGLIIALSSGRAMGIGDMKLAGALGLLLGWPDIVLAIALAFVVGAVWGVLLLILKKKSLKAQVPFGPFLVAGFWLVVFFGHRLVDWYFSLF